jgi:glycosyltransferase involved in cell wall biosynthesis
MGRHEHEALASLIANAQVFVFPSKTDTFGLVILEALACGTPVAAYPEPGPLEVIRQGINGIYNEDLFQAVMGCWHLDREKVRASTEKYSWERSTSEWLLFG